MEYLGSKRQRDGEGGNEKFLDEVFGSGVRWLGAPIIWKKKFRIDVRTCGDVRNGCNKRWGGVRIDE